MSCLRVRYAGRSVGCRDFADCGQSAIPPALAAVLEPRPALHARDSRCASRDSAVRSRIPANSKYHQRRCVRSCASSGSGDRRRRRRRRPARAAGHRGRDFRRIDRLSDQTPRARRWSPPPRSDCPGGPRESRKSPARRARARRSARLRGPGACPRARAPGDRSDGRRRAAAGRAGGSHLGEIDHLPDGRPVGRSRYGEMPRHLVNERQEHRLERQIVPEQIERRRPQQHAAAAELPFDQRRRAVVEARQHLRVLGRRHGAIAVEARGRKIAAARRAERLEHRMAVREPAERAGGAARCDRRRPAAVAGSRSAALPGHDACAPVTTSRPPPFSTKRFSRAAVASGGLTSLRMITRVRLSASSLSPSIARERHVEARALADRERAREIERRVARAARHERHVHRPRRRQHEMKRVVAASASSPMRTAPRVLVRRDRDRRERRGRRRRSASSDTCVVCTTWPSISSDDVEVGDRLGAAIDHAAGDDDAILTGKRLALHDRRRHRDVLRVAGLHRRPASPRCRPAGAGRPPRVQPLRWKSLISTTSRRGRFDSASRLPASLSAGP